MKEEIKYIEHKPLNHTDKASAWIARTWISSSGKTIYFNDMALKRCSGYDSNHYDLETGEDFWVTGVKKSGSNRHYSKNVIIFIEKSLVKWYEKHTNGKGHKKLEIISDLPKPDISKFNKLENESVDEK